MNKIQKQQSIVLIGPKAVGKTLISSKLSRQTNMPVISSDLLTNLIAISLSSGLNDSLSSSLKKDNDFYASLFNYKELAHFVYKLAELKQDERISEKTKKLAMQYWKIRLMEEATEKLNFPVIFDLGADIGAVYKLNEQESKELEKSLFLYEGFITSRQADFLKQFDTRFYIKPSKEYFSSTNDRIANLDNELYLQNPKSYVSFATNEISTENLYSKKKFSLTEKELERLTTDEREELINSTKLDEITNEILLTKSQQSNPTGPSSN